MSNELDIIRALVELGDKATEGPWERRLYQSGTVAVGTATRHSIHICYPNERVPVPGDAGEFTGNWEDDKTTDAELRRLDNAAFIAASKNAIPALRALLARLAALEKVAKAAEWLRKVELQRQRDDDDSCASGATHNIQVWAEAEASLDAALKEARDA